MGGILAYFAYPLYKWINKHFSDTIASLVVCVIILALLVVPAVFIINVLVEDSYTTFNLIKEKLSVGLLSECTNSLCQRVESLIQLPSVKGQIQTVTEFLTSKVFQLGSQFLLSLPRFILNLFVMFFTLFYFLKHGKHFLVKISKYLSMQKKEYAYILSRLSEIVHGVVYGYLMVALIQGALGALGFLIFGVSSPFFWGLIMALFALIPILGTGVVWVPASLILFFDGMIQSSNSLMFKGIGLFLYGLLIVSTIDNILKPKLISEKAKVHPVIIMIGVFGGLLLFGPLGVIIGPLVLATTQVVFETYLNKKV
jgi:predicted PurR-regulated permease PerM